MNDVEGLMIYKQYMELIYYMENIVLKYPKCEKLSLVSNIKNNTYLGMKKIIMANKEFNKGKRINILNDLDTDMKILKVLIRLSYKKKYISDKKLLWLTKLFIYDGGYEGIPIGNYTSQYFANIYLNELDYYVKDRLKIKYYVRYMDDMVIFSMYKEYLKDVKEKITRELREKYLLDINKKKTLIVNIREGFTFCGYRFRIVGKKTIINVCRETVKRVKKRVKEVRYLYSNNKMSFKQTFCSINTYYNGFKYGSKKRIQRIVDKYFFG